MKGNITVSAQAAGFMAGLLGIIVQASSDMAQAVPDSAGVVFVPALAGLGAPHWDDAAAALVTGMTLGIIKAHLARSAFEAITLQFAAVLNAMGRDMGQPLTQLRADGGISANPFLMQLHADVLRSPVLRSPVLRSPVLQSPVAEIGALGAAAMAFFHLGVQMPLEPMPGPVHAAGNAQGVQRLAPDLDCCSGTGAGQGLTLVPRGSYAVCAWRLAGIVGLSEAAARGITGHIKG